MFQIISILSFIVVLGGIGLHRLIYSNWQGPETQITLGTCRIGPRYFRKLAFLFGLLSFSVLLFTGFGPLLFGLRLHGYLLMIHATFAPVFIACVAFIAVTSAEQYAFNEKDLEQIPCPGCKPAKLTAGCCLTDTGLGAKLGFWILLVMSLPVTLSMVLSMLPLFGPQGQDFLFQAHRWSALIFALTLIVELYILIRMRAIKDTKQ